VSLFGPWDNRDSLRGTIAAHQALGELLQLAWKLDLPALRWSMSGIGGLSGVVPTDYENRAEREAWRQWVAAIGATVSSTPFVDSTGVEYLRATVENYRPKRGNLVTIHLQAAALTDAALAQLAQEAS
jgi:hypothetical protein